MSSPSNAYISQRILGPLVHIRLGGTLDETLGSLELQHPVDAALPSSGASAGRDTVLVLDLAHVERVTMWGVRHWLNLMKEAERMSRAVLIARAPPCVVEQLNTVEGFQGSAIVLSVLAPYVCDACNHAQQRPLVLAEHMVAIRADRAPQLSCPTCSGPMAFDDLPSLFFSFANAQPDTFLAPEVVTFNEWLCGPESSTEVDARFLTHVRGASLYALQAQARPPGQPSPVRPPAPVRPVERAPSAVPTRSPSAPSQPVTNVSAVRSSVLAAGYRHVASPEDAFLFIKQLTTALPIDATGRPVVNLFDGVLEPQHATLLDDPGKVLLLACREADKSPSSWELRLLNRLLRRAPLMPPGCSETTYKIGSIDSMHAVSQATGALVEASGGGAATRDIAVDVAYELMANALLDAPADDQGNAKYAFERETVTTVDPSDHCHCSLSVHDGKLYIRVVDRFGRLARAHVAKALAHAGAARVALDMSGGGAGLGFRRILSGMDALVVFVRPSERTEMCAVLKLGGSVRRRDRLPKSLFIDAPI